MRRRTLLRRFVGATVPVCLAGCVSSSGGNEPTTAPKVSDGSGATMKTTSDRRTETISSGSPTSTEIVAETDAEFAACERRNQQLPDVTVENRDDTKHTVRVSITKTNASTGERSTVFRHRYEVAAGQRVATKVAFTAPNADTSEREYRATATLGNGRSESNDISIVAIQPLLYGVSVVIDSGGMPYVFDSHVDVFEDFDQMMCFDGQTTRRSGK